MPSVQFSNVSKRFGSFTALRDLDLDIAEGEFVSLLGPSGSGKTTTLNLLAGLIPIDEGEVTIGDRRVNDLSPDKRDIAMVFQNYALYPHMTVFENLAFPLRARRRRQPETELRRKVEDVAEILGVATLLARYPKELSGGQQQRIALGRAMVRDPSVFLLDEPLSNLDARLRIRMRRDIKALHDRIGSTIVYVTHDQAEALTLSSRIAVFSEGRLQQYASPFDIYNYPANIFVANFVGEREINLIEGTVSQRDGSLVFSGGGLESVLHGDAFEDPTGREIVFGIRSEGLTALHGEAAPHELQGRVLDAELIGADQIIYVMAGTSELSCRADPRMTVAKGDRVRVVVDPEKILLFDKNTTVNLRRVNECAGAKSCASPK